MQNDLTYIHKNRKQLKLIFTFLVVMMQVINVYASPIPSVAWGELLVLILLPILLFDLILNYKSFSWNSYWIFAIYGLLITSIVLIINPTFAITEAVKRLIRDAIYFIIFGFFGLVYFEYDFGIKCYKVVTIALCCFIFFQSALYLLGGYYMPGFLLNAELSNGYSGADLMSHYHKLLESSSYLRSNGFLLEPAHCAQYLIAALVIALFPIDGEKKTSYKMAFIITSAMLLTFSANAFVFVIATWLIWITVNYNKKIKVRTLFRIVLAFVVIMGVTVYLVISNNAFHEVIMRLLTIGKDSTVNSASLRVIRGIAFFHEMPGIYKVFGMGFGNFDSFKLFYKISTVYEMDTEYMSTNSYILTSAGMIGFLLYIASLFNLCKNKPFQTKALVLILLVMGLSSSVYSTPVYILFMLFIMNKQNDRLKA